MTVLIVRHIQTCGGLWLASGGGNTIDLWMPERLEKDDAASAPRPGRTADGSLTNDLRRAAGEVEPLQFACCEERQRAAIGRPKRRIDELSAGERGGRQ